MSTNEQAAVTTTTERPEMNPDDLLVVNDVKKYFPITRGIIFQKQIAAVQAVDGVSFTVARGETLGIVGESGCGKSTLARCLVRLLTPQAGRIVYDGLDVLSLEEAKQRGYSRRVQMVFQDPYSSLNPRMAVGQMLAEAIRFHGLRQGAGVEQRIGELLDLVRLPTDAKTRYPHEF